MQPAEILLPASPSGPTVPSLYALYKQHPILGRLTGRVPPLVCSLLHLYQHFQYARKPDIETLLEMGGCPSRYPRTPNTSDSYAATAQEQGVLYSNPAYIQVYVLALPIPDQVLPC